MLLENGNKVFGVEPNAKMRQAGERLLAGFPKFMSVAGTAEVTTLADASVHFVTAAQAAHWFDRERARQEFLRILKPGGWLVLLWNERITDSTAFLRDYEHLLLSFGTDYQEVRHEFDYAGLQGRLLSSSYAPGPEHPKHEPMLRELRRIFDSRAIGGRVAFDYKTRVYFGRLG